MNASGSGTIASLHPASSTVATFHCSGKSSDCNKKNSVFEDYVTIRTDIHAERGRRQFQLKPLADQGTHWNDVQFHLEKENVLEAEKNQLQVEKDQLEEDKSIL
ncbi:hypothetical protein PGQ11_006104 [Apiospora arundinis]|uniref:CS domain-containing protein n=1 Tax=Apiospora arundinis TaxID=335852 RepID=A0ABR2ISI0_9PEZI